ncbi:hypothetical protein PR371_26275 [Mycobacterium marinum]|uniref:hypothetical protein n=1 Tax=Mycobacterium marinum TaxID=1781 RepID=UPI00234280C2|nr:hypothetical protein [Mycobacterium marinum]MDC8997459.1 hypothetical protein [Mycobacterium marinum]WDZ13006.1 hypothetical protein PQR73_020545 [Mycobacterium marinum]
MGVLAGVDRKTARDYTNAAELAGFDRGGDLDQLTDELIGAVIEAVRPGRPDGHGATWELLRANHDQIVEWVGKDLTVVKIGDLLARRTMIVPQRTLHRCCTQCTAYWGRGSAGTVPVVDGEPGEERQIDFGKMGKIFDPGSGRNRVVYALISTAVYSRHMFVWLTFNQTLEAILAGCEAAWGIFGGVFKVLIPDNMAPIVPKADSTDPQISLGWTEHSQARGFFTDPARVAHPCDKPPHDRKNPAAPQIPQRSTTRRSQRARQPTEIPSVPTSSTTRAVTTYPRRPVRHQPPRTALGGY